MSARESATVDRDHLKSETRFMDGGKAMQHDILNTEVTTIDGQKTTLADYAGRVLLIVNVASKCSLTPQYEQLETLQKDLGHDGLTVLGFLATSSWARSQGAKRRLRRFVVRPMASLSAVQQGRRQR
jgi:glutathione peroxidase